MAVNSVRYSFLCNNSGLSILLHGVISLPDVTSYDIYNITTQTRVNWMKVDQDLYMLH